METNVVRGVVALFNATAQTVCCVFKTQQGGPWKHLSCVSYVYSVRSEDSSNLDAAGLSYKPWLKLNHNRIVVYGLHQADQQG